MISQPHEHRSMDAITANKMEQFAARMEQMVGNSTSLRERLVSSYNDPRRDLNKECGYPDTNNIDITMYRDQYDRNAIATRVVQVWPLESWQAQPVVYENEDPEVETPFEIAWNNLGKNLRGKGFAKSTENKSHPVWEYLRRGDILSGIGFFGGILLGIDDGKELDQPIDGFDDDAPDLTKEMESDKKTQSQDLFGKGQAFGGTDKTATEGASRENPPGKAGEFSEDNGGEEGSVDDLPPKKKKKPLPITGNIGFNRDEDDDPEQDDEEETPDEEAEDSSLPTVADDQGAMESKPGDVEKEVETKRKLLYLRAFDESLMQVTQWVDNPNSPRFGLPKMYLITFNDPKDRQQGAGLGTQTKMVHWSRVIHLADNRGSSESAGVPRMRPVYDNVLDCKKYLGGGAEGAWKGSFPGFSLETHPQLGGDVAVDLTAARETMERYFNSLQRAIITEGMTVNSLAPQVVDCSPQLDMEITVICILLGIPKRIFMGSERGELASSQDDSTWNDRLADRQAYYITPHIIEPFIDRLIQIGVLPVPTEGYTVEWPDLNSLSALEKAQVATARVNALVAFIAGDVESLIDPVDFLTKFLDIDEEEAKAMLEKAAERIKTQMDEAMENEDGLMDLRTKEAEDKEAEMEAQREGFGKQPPGFGNPTGGGPPGKGQFPPKGAKPNKEAGQKSKSSRSVPPFSANADCGTGAGGFKKGNTCAKGNNQTLVSALKSLDYSGFEISRSKPQFVLSGLKSVASSLGIEAEMSVLSDKDFNEAISHGAKKMGVAPDEVRAAYRYKSKSLLLRDRTIQSVKSKSDYRLLLQTVFHELGHAYDSQHKGSSASLPSSLTHYEVDKTEDFADVFGARLGLVFKKLGGGKVGRDLSKTTDYVSYLTANVENSGCGAGSEGDAGFQPGNDCAKGGKGVTQTKAFKKWFGNSKVVDDKGKPLVVYHGTMANGFNEFRTDGPENPTWEDEYILDRMVGPHFAEDPAIASKFASKRDVDDPNKPGNVKPVYLSLQNPKVINQVIPEEFRPYPDTIRTDQTAINEDILNETMPHNKELFVSWYTKARASTPEHASEVFDRLTRGESIVGGASPFEPGGRRAHLNPVAAFVADYDSGLLQMTGPQRRKLVIEYKQRLLTKGFDGLQYINTSPMETEGATSRNTFIAFKPTQIKSATGNKGTFNPDDPDIRNKARGRN